MVLQSYWLAAGAFAVVMTFTYLFRPDERVTFTSLFAGVAWAWMALVGGSVEVYAAGTLQDATASSLQYVTFGLAALSFLVTILYRFGEYPPSDDDGLSDDGGTN